MEFLTSGEMAWGDCVCEPLRWNANTRMNKKINLNLRSVTLRVRNEERHFTQSCQTCHLLQSRRQTTTIQVASITFWFPSRCLWLLQVAIFRWYSAPDDWHGSNKSQAIDQSFYPKWWRKDRIPRLCAAIWQRSSKRQRLKELGFPARTKSHRRTFWRQDWTPKL